MKKIDKGRCKNVEKWNLKFYFQHSFVFVEERRDGEKNWRDGVVENLLLYLHTEKERQVREEKENIGKNHKWCPQS